jgi:hypothetical protein
MISFGILNHFHDLNKILSLDLTGSNCKKCNYMPHGRNRTCDPTIPVPDIFYKKNLVPEHLKNIFLLNSQIHNYNTRRANEFHIVTPRTHLRQFSIKYQGPFLYNSLDNDIVNSVSLSSFAKKLKKLFCSMYN